MKTKLISIVWNDKLAIYSIDCNRYGVIASAGADNCVNVLLTAHFNSFGKLESKKMAIL